MNDTTGTSATHNGLNPTTTYYYRVIANGYHISTSGTGSDTTEAPPVSAPTGVAASDGNVGSITISWTHSGTYVTEFEVWRDGTRVADALGTGTRNWTDTSMTIGNDCSYVVRTVNGSDTADSSADTGWAKIPAPTGLSDSYTGPGGTPTREFVNISWNAVTGATLYEVDADGADWYQSVTTPVTGTSSYWEGTYSTAWLVRTYISGRDHVYSDWVTQ